MRQTRGQMQKTSELSREHQTLSTIRGMS